MYGDKISLYDIQKILHQYNKQKKEVDDANTELKQTDLLWHHYMYLLFGKLNKFYFELAPKTFRICKTGNVNISCEYDDVCINGRYIKRIDDGLLRVYVSFDIEELVRFVILTDADFAYEHMSRAVLFGAYSMMLLQRMLDKKPKYRYRIGDWRFYRFASKDAANIQLVSVISMYLQAMMGLSKICKNRRTILSKMYNVEPKMIK